MRALRISAAALVIALGVLLFGVPGLVVGIAVAAFIMRWLWVHAIISRSSFSMATSGPRGRLRASRWEFGVGKGQWARRARMDAEQLGLEGTKHSLYLLLAARYTISYEGRASAVERLYGTL